VGDIGILVLDPDSLNVPKALIREERSVIFPKPAEVIVGLPQELTCLRVPGVVEQTEWNSGLGMQEIAESSLHRSHSNRIHGPVPADLAFLSGFSIDEVETVWERGSRIQTPHVPDLLRRLGFIGHSVRNLPSNDEFIRDHAFQGETDLQPRIEETRVPAGLQELPSADQMLCWVSGLSILSGKHRSIGQLKKEIEQPGDVNDDK
jgi:hypothetical protein